MAITPIDLQVNVGQLYEVGRNEHAKINTLSEQRHLLHEEAARSADLKKSRLDEITKAGEADIKDVLSKENEDGGRRQNRRNKKQPEKEEKENALSEDSRLGGTVDVLIK